LGGLLRNGRTLGGNNGGNGKEYREKDQ